MIGLISDVKRFVSHHFALKLYSKFAPYTNVRSSACGTAKSVRSLKPSIFHPRCSSRLYSGRYSPPSNQSVMPYAHSVTPFHDLFDVIAPGKAGSWSPSG